MKIAAAYIRVSTDDQIEYSPDSQLKLIRKYAKDHDMIIPEDFVFVDEGISGRTTKKRPAFNRMIGMAKKKPKPFETILLWKFSRFARNREDSIVYKSMLRKQLGIEVISISEDVGDDKMAVITEAMIEAMDEFYSLNLSEEVRRGMSERVSRGLPVTTAPYGYDMINKELVINKDEAAIVKKIFFDFVNGITAQSITRNLNIQELTTKRGNQWSRRTVTYMLTNPIYIGQIRWSGDRKRDYHNRYYVNCKTIQGQHKPIIDDETFTLAQTKIIYWRDRYQSYAKEHVINEYMLRGMVYCSDCDHTLVIAYNKRYLQCSGYSHATCNVSHHVSLNALSERVIETIETDMTTGNFMLPEVSNKELEVTDARLSFALEKLNRVKEAYEAGIDTIEEYSQNKQKIQKEIDDIIAEKPNKIKKRDKVVEAKKNLELCKTLKDPGASGAQKNSVLRSFVSKIVYNKAKNSITIFYT